MTEWHSGPPPSLGWWPASLNRNSSELRFRHAGAWSLPLTRKASMKCVARIALSISDQSERVEWQYRPDDWPERSRT